MAPRAYCYAEMICFFSSGVRCYHHYSLHLSTSDWQISKQMLHAKSQIF